MAATARDPAVRGFRLGIVFLAFAFTAFLYGCAHTGKRLEFQPQTLTPADTTGGHHPERAVRRTPGSGPEHALYGSDTLIGFRPGTGDSSRRYLGRLMDGYTADTLNLILLGDNRPGYRMSRIQNEIAVLRKGISLNPVRIGHALITLPVALWKGMWPDAGLIRDIPNYITGTPTWGREHQVLAAVMAKLDTLKTQKRTVAAVINTGDLVYSGRNPKHWRRFLRIWEPLSTRVPYLAVAGNHEKTWDSLGLANWRTATGLPIASDRMYYCFDSADGWVRFVALDSNPITMPGVHWSKEVQVDYSKEQVDWLTARLKEHRGPSIVFLHSPPFSAGYHRHDWEHDPLMEKRRDQIVKAMHEVGISVLVGGHEHNYERALITFPDKSVLITMVQGGAGAPLHPLPPPAQAAQMFASYKIPNGGTIKPENVYTAVINNFTLLRLWFGGGELQTFSVNKDASVKMVDQVKIDLKRYGKPKIGQNKVVVAPSPSGPSSMQARATHGVPTKSDTLAPSQRLQTQRPPGKKIKAVTARSRRTAKPSRTSATKPTTPASTEGTTHQH